jgi:ornithine cyclodeaminase/alanine dehydrogenase-like protein (mu-crystallin family)
LKDEADAVAERLGGSVEPMLLDVVARPDLLEKYVRSSDIVVSLLPYSLHPTVAQSCIDSGTHMVTASYCSPQMKELHDKYVKHMESKQKIKKLYKLFRIFLNSIMHCPLITLSDLFGVIFAWPAWI